MSLFQAARSAIPAHPCWAGRALLASSACQPLPATADELHEACLLLIPFPSSAEPGGAGGGVQGRGCWLSGRSGDSEAEQALRRAAEWSLGFVQEELTASTGMSVLGDLSEVPP